AERGETAFVSGERALRVVRADAGTVGRLFAGVERGAGDRLVRQRGECGLVRSELFGGFAGGGGDLFAPAVEQRRRLAGPGRRRPRLVGGARRGATRLVGFGEPLARRRRHLDARGEGRGHRRAPVAQFLHAQFDLRALRGERVE